MASINIKKDGQWTGKPVLGFKVGEENLTDDLKEKIANGADVDLSGYATKEEIEALTAADVDAAPVGYGLGVETPELISDCNNAVNNGWYRVTGAANLPNGYTDGWMSVSSFNSSYKRQDFFNEYVGGIHAVRYMNKNWGEWEWVNPPMTPDTEYRTTERHQGKVVYTKLLNYGALPNNTEKNVAAMPAGSNMISASGYAVGPSYNVPIPGYYAIQSFGSTRSTGKFWLSTTIDMSSYNGWITIKYTKD